MSFPIASALGRASDFFWNLRRVLLALLGVIVLIVGFMVFQNECAFGGAMGEAYRDCDCRGKELQLFDHTPADGSRKTVCIGIIRSVTCYEFRGGPETECPSRPDI